MSQSITIHIAPTGATRLETHGFSGAECQEASRFLEQALGQQSSEQLKPEYHQSASNRQQLREDV